MLTLNQPYKLSTYINVRSEFFDGLSECQIKIAVASHVTATNVKEVLEKSLTKLSFKT